MEKKQLTSRLIFKVIAQYRICNQRINMSKRKVLTLQERINVIELSKSKSARKIAEELGVGKTQIQTILKRKADVFEDFENNLNSDSKRRRRMTGNEDVNDLVQKWFKDMSGRNLPISGPLICQQALKFASELGNTTFKASTGWLSCFLKRNNIVFGTMSGERGDVDSSVVDSWKSRIPQMCDGFSPKDIFNMDETGLFFRDTTKKSFHFKGEDLAGGKRSKERITVALCASMTGEKLTPLVIGKAAKPRCFSKVNPDNLPVTYRNNRKAWMTTEIMLQWLRSVDRMMKKQGRHILLFLDNAPSHPKVELTNIKLQFLPPNTTALSQPMDQGIIQALKLKFRNRQLKNILTQMEKNDQLGSDALRKISILDAIYWISAAWKEVDSSTIVKCFAKCGFSVDSVCSDRVSGVQAVEMEEEEEDDNVPLSVLKMSHEIFGCSFKELIDIDRDMQVCDTDVTDWNRDIKDIISDMRGAEVEEINGEEEKEEEEAVPPVSASEARACIETLRQYTLNVGHVDMLHSIMNFQELFVDSRVEANTKQTKISDYFQKK